MTFFKEVLSQPNSRRVGSAMNAQAVQLTYHIADVPLHVWLHDAADEVPMRQLMDGLFRFSPVDRPVFDEPGSALSLTLRRRPLSHGKAGNQADTMAPEGHDGFWITAKGIAFTAPGGQIEVYPQEARAEGQLSTAFWQSPLYDRRSLLLRTVIMLLRQRDIYSLHAGALLLPQDAPSRTAADSGLLITGASGAGKTTLTLGLINAGWRFVGDNVVTLCQDWRTEMVQVRALQRGFACTAQTMACFPWLQSTAHSPLTTLEGKHLLFTDDLYPEQFVPQCTPRVLLFPQVTTAAQTTLEPIDATEALLALLPQSLGLLAHSDQTQAQLQMVRTLVDQSSAYRVYSGRDLIERPADVAALITRTIK